MGRFTDMPRADVVQFLEANGFAAYDSEPTDALREAAFLHEEEMETAYLHWDLAYGSD
jgi:hypothetical protein